MPVLFKEAEQATIHYMNHSQLDLHARGVQESQKEYISVNLLVVEAI